MKKTPGEKTTEILKAVEDKIFCGVAVNVSNKRFINRNQFLQALIDRMESRLIKNDDPLQEILRDFSIIEEVFPQQSVDDIGEMSVRNIARYFNIPEQTAVCDFRLRNYHSLLWRTMKTIPVATAERERGFSQMNNIVTDLRANKFEKSNVYQNSWNRS